MDCCHHIHLYIDYSELGRWSPAEVDLVGHGICCRRGVAVELVELAEVVEEFMIVEESG